MTWVGWVGVVVLGVTACIRAFSMPLNADVGWWLHISRRMLAGDVLYRDLVEINAPMTAYVSMIPVWVSRLTGLPIGAASAGFTLVLLLCVAAWTAVLMGRPDAPGTDRPVIAATVLVMAGWLSGADVSQREHLMFILILPYTVVVWRRAIGLDVSLSASLAAGLAAGIGLALKPHFVVIPVFIEVVHYLETRGKPGRSLRSLCTVERVTLLAALTTFGLTVLLNSSYLSLLAAYTDLYMQFSAIDRIRIVASGFTIGLLICSIAAFRVRSDLGRLSRFLLGVGFAGLVLAAIQAKGWSYHLFPVMASVIGAAILVTYDLAQRARKSPKQTSLLDWSVVLMTISVSFILTGPWLRWHATESATQASAVEEQVQYLDGIEARGSLLVLSMIVPRSFPLVNYSGLEWASPFPSMWWIRARPEERRLAVGQRVVTDLAVETAAERKLTSMLVGKFLESKPGTVFVDTAGHRDFGGAQFPLITYLEQDMRFQSAWQSYARIDAVGPFTVWTRKPVADLAREPGSNDAP